MTETLGDRRLRTALGKWISVGPGSVALLLLVGLALSLPAQQEAKPEAPAGADTSRSLAPAPPSPEETAALAALMGSPNPADRLTLVEEFLDNYPDSLLRGRAYAAASEAYRMQNNFKKSVEYGEKALEVNPRDALVMIVVADALVEGANPIQPDYEEQLGKAEQYAKKALEILPDLFAAAQRPAEMTEEDYQLRLHYIEAQPHATLGFLYLRRRDFPAAEGELKQATELNQMRPNGVDFLRLGFAHMRQEEWTEAKAAFERSIEIGGSTANTARQQLERVESILEHQKQPSTPRPE